MQKYQNLEVHIIPIYSDNYIFIVKCLKSGVVFCIDPGDFSPIDNFLIEKGWNLDFILNTHHHFDHISGNLQLKEKYNCKIVGNKNDAARIPGIDIKVEDNQIIHIGEIELKVIFVYGHTIGHIAYFIATDNILFSADVIFSSGCGYLFEGTAQQMYNSLEKIKQLPENTKIYCAHEYTLDNIEFALSIEPNNSDLQNKLINCQELRAKNIATIPTDLKNELATNPFLRTNSAEIRHNLKMIDNQDVEVFARIRSLKDSW